MRYFAYMLAVASSQFALSSVYDRSFFSNEERKQNARQPCQLRTVSEVTLIPYGWKLWLLILGISVAEMIMDIGTANDHNS